MGYMSDIQRSCRTVAIALVVICFSSIVGSCSTESNSKKATDTLNAFRIHDLGEFLFEYGDEVYNIFYNWNDVMDIDSICKEFSVEIDSTISICVDCGEILFDTICYSNYCYERIVFDKQSVILTNEESFIHVCSRVGHINICFKLTDYEKHILSSLVMRSNFSDLHRNQINKYIQEDYAINSRFRYVYNGEVYELVVSDTSPEYIKYSMLNSFVLGITNKYLNKHINDEEEYAPFLVPLHLP